MTYKLNNTLARTVVSVGYAVTAQFWLLSVFINSQISLNRSYISDLFVPNQPYAWLFRILEVLNGLVLLMIVIPPLNSGLKDFKYKLQIGWLTRILAILTVFDGIFVSSCLSVKNSCRLTGLSLLSTSIHGAESIVSVVVLLVLILLAARSYKKYAALFYSLLTSSVLIIILQEAGSHVILGRGGWQRLFSVVTAVAIGLIFIV